MEEKVMYIKLPEGANYRRVIMTEDGLIGIVYAEEGIEKIHLGGRIVVPLLPKPYKLAGGTEVYQKEGLPYWFCKINNTRDEFMNVYMKDLQESDLYYDSQTGMRRIFKTEREQEFRDNVLEALSNKPKKGYRWIATHEPSSDGMGGLQFVSDKRPLIGLSLKRWIELVKKFSPENYSKCMTKTTYFLLLLRWLKDGYVTLNQLVEHSEQIAHYNDSLKPKKDLEKTGERMFGGLYGIIGNTYKLIEDPKSKTDYSLAGGCYKVSGNKYPISEVNRIDLSESKLNLAVAIVELSR